MKPLNFDRIIKVYREFLPKSLEEPGPGLQAVNSMLCSLTGALVDCINESVLSPETKPETKGRKIVQVTMHNEDLYALCDDGTLWYKSCVGSGLERKYVWKQDKDPFHGETIVSPVSLPPEKSTARIADEIARALISVIVYGGVANLRRAWQDVDVETQMKFEASAAMRVQKLLDDALER